MKGRVLLLVLLAILWMIPELVARLSSTDDIGSLKGGTALSWVILVLMVAALIQGLRGNPLALSVLAAITGSYGVAVCVAAFASDHATYPYLIIGLAYLAMTLVVLLLRIEVLEDLETADATRSSGP